MNQKEMEAHLKKCHALMQEIRDWFEDVSPDVYNFEDDDGVDLLKARLDEILVSKEKQ